MKRPTHATVVSRSRFAESFRRARHLARLSWHQPPGTPSGTWVHVAILALLVLLVAHALGPLESPTLRQADRWLYDLRLRVMAPAAVDPGIVIVDIDERSLAEQGRWPWNRSLLADLLTQTAEHEGARLIGLDLVLADPESRSTPNAGPGQQDGDALLAQALSRYPVVLGFHLSNEAGAARIGDLPPALAQVATLGQLADGLTRWAGHGGNVRPLAQAGKLGAGHLNAIVDPDGRLRSLPVLAQHDGGVHGTLALAMARALLGEGTPSGLAGLSFEPAEGPLRAVHLLRTTPGQVQSGQGQNLRVPLDVHGTALVPYSAPGTTYVRVSAGDVLAHRLAPGALRDKVVIVGVSAPGLIDQRATPVDEVMPGTLVHAHLLAGILDGRVLTAPSQAPLIEAATLLLLGALLWRWLPRVSLWPGVLLTGAAMLAVLALQAAAWVWAGWVLPLAASLLLPLVMLALTGLQALRTATGARRQLVLLFGQYVPPELVDQMSLRPERYTMGSRGAELTVLFADVQGFSGRAEHMPPAELGAMMNLIFSHLTDVVRDHRGTLDKYIGDSVMAFWGAPLDEPEHARQAVNAALAMQARLPALHDAMAAQGWPPIQVNIGINTGSMVVGDMGSVHRRAYTVMGDAVNLAARLQTLCSEHELGVVIGDTTHQALGDTQCLALGHIKVRGRDAPIQVWHPLPWRVGQNPAIDQFTRRWAQMREAIEGGRLDRANELLDGLQARPELQALGRWQRQRLVNAQGPDPTLHPAA